MVFAVIYFMSWYFSLGFIFAWNAFGGTANLEWWQELIMFFFQFPGVELPIQRLSTLVVSNTIFWTFIYYLFVKIIRTSKLKILP